MVSIHVSVLVTVPQQLIKTHFVVLVDRLASRNQSG